MTKAEKIGLNLYKVKIPWWSLSVLKRLTEALLELQNSGYEIYSISRCFGFFSYTFLVMVKLPRD